MTWWIYNFIHKIHYYFNFYYDQFVCQQWRHNNNFKDTLRKETRIFLFFEFHSLICFQVINFSYTTENSTSATRMKPREFQSISRLATHADWLLFISSLLQVTSSNIAALNCFKSFPHFQELLAMYRNISLNECTDSEVFYVEHSAAETSPIRNNTPAILNCTQLSGPMEPDAITISSVASPEPRIVTIDSDANEPTFPYAFGTQRLTKHLTPLSRDQHRLPQAHPPHRPLHHDKREVWALGCLFLKSGECRSTPARHAASPLQQERHPNAQGKLKPLKLLIRLSTD